MIKISKLLESNIHPLVHGALLSRIIESNNDNYFAALSSYQESKKISSEEFNFFDYTNTYVEKLNEIIGENLWISYEDYKNNFKYTQLKLNGKEKAILLIENDLKLKRKNFFNKLYAKLFTSSPWFEKIETTEDIKHFLRGFCELRGSIDTKLKFLAMDYFYENNFELQKVRILTDYFNLPISIFNLNFRELQKEFTENKNKRNTQFRISLKWYVKNIGLINDYKAKIVCKEFTNNQITIDKNVLYIDIGGDGISKYDAFLDRLTFYTKNIYGKQITNDEINKLRIELEFDKENNINSEIKRNRNIVELVRLLTKDECSGCKDRYNIKDRTFMHKRTGRLYFEIHHNISFNNKIELDHQDNLVKLCPVCHSCLKAGIGSENEQKMIITNILDNNKNVEFFAQNFFDIYNRNELIKKIYENLK